MGASFESGKHMTVKAEGWAPPSPYCAKDRRPSPCPLRPHHYVILLPFSWVGTLLANTAQTKSG